MCCLDSRTMLLPHLIYFMKVCARRTPNIRRMR
jgi:hypothetical protein